MTELTIQQATPDHAPAIARAVIMAIGPEIELSLAGAPERLPLVTETFTTLAARPDTQYSYLNTLVALTPDGEVAGVLVSYDGARLLTLRRTFFDTARDLLGLSFDDTLEPETSPDEIYLDSLAVFPGWRGHGLARRLIRAAALRHASSGKPLGLLVEPDNKVARSLYTRLGFRDAGMRPFAGVAMHHMQLDPSTLITPAQ